MITDDGIIHVETVLLRGTKGKGPPCDEESFSFFFLQDQTAMLATMASLSHCPSLCLPLVLTHLHTAAAGSSVPGDRHRLAPQEEQGSVACPVSSLAGAAGWQSRQWRELSGGTRFPSSTGLVRWN